MSPISRPPRRPTPSVAVLVAADSALVTAAEVVRRLLVLGGVDITLAATIARALPEDDAVRDVLVKGLEHVRSLDRQRRDAELQSFADSLHAEKTRRERVEHDLRECRRELAIARDTRRED